MKKYELLTNDTITAPGGATLYRIRSLVAIAVLGLPAGAIGGYVEGEHNLSHDGNAWVGDGAWVYGNAHVYGDAWVGGDAWVYGDAKVYGDAWVGGNAKVYGDAKVYGNAKVGGNARVLSPSHILWITGVGSEHGTLTIFRSETGVLVSRGCFLGTTEEFFAASAVTHERMPDIAEEYRILVNLAVKKVMK